MGDSKRWTVTYTKHIKQKRKLYQDGFLQLQISTNKVALYDECDKLLECRLLKKDETVTSGETLEFNGYLVDVGDPEGEGHNKPQSDLKVDTKHKTGSTFRTTSASGDTKMNTKGTIARTRKPLSPSQQIIKEFKKRELLKYGSPQISPETVKHSTSEWQVLYTTQLTQKSKKYHDGFVQLVIRGSRGGQVMLFDESRKLLDSRFLKKDDVIRPGESITFDAYLVDIGERQGNHKPHCSVQGENFTNFERVEKMDRQHTSLDTENYAAAGKSGQPPSKPCLGQDAGLSSLFPGKEEINRIVPPIKPLRDANQILSFLQDPSPQESCVIGGRSPNGSCHNIVDSESTETNKSLDATFSKAAAAGGGGFQLSGNVKMPHQPYSDKNAQTHMSETDVGLFISNSGDHSSCILTNESESAEEFSCDRETFPSFDLGF